jgi:molybdopterin converting factor small subunit
VDKMEIHLKLYGSSKMLSDKEIIYIKLPNNSNIEKLRSTLNKIISEKYLKSDLKNLSKTAAFFSEADEVINDNYKLKDKELISIIPPIGGG